MKLAEELMRRVLGPSLDELPPQTKRLLSLIEEMVNEECKRQEIEADDYRFTRRTVRQHTRWGDTQLRVHLRRLEELEYLTLRRGGGQGQRYVYQLRTEETMPTMATSRGKRPTSRGQMITSRVLRGPFAGVVKTIHRQSIRGFAPLLRGIPKTLIRAWSEIPVKS